MAENNSRSNSQNNALTNKSIVDTWMTVEPTVRMIKSTIDSVISGWLTVGLRGTHTLMRHMKEWLCEEWGHMKACLGALKMILWLFFEHHVGRLSRELCIWRRKLIFGLGSYVVSDKIVEKKGTAVRKKCR